MLELFANSLLNGFIQSSGMGKSLVAIQLIGSLVMGTYIIGKWLELRELTAAARRVRRDVMGQRSVLDYFLARRDSLHTPLENVYAKTCDRLLKRLTPDMRSLLLERKPGVIAALTEHEMELVKSIGEQALDDEFERVDDGMGVIATIVALAPMVGLLGTVWGVLDAFADMGAAGSATIATMAPAISSALLTTVVGLLVAIPGMAFHNSLTVKVHALQSDMEGFLDDLTGRIALEFQDTGSRS